MSALATKAGIDTVRFRWRGDYDTYMGFQRRPEGTIMGYRGEAFVQTEFGRMGAYPDGMVYIEGRANAMALQDKNDHGLASVENLHSAEQFARSVVRSNGADVESDARIGRIDLASELRFFDPEQGSAFLHSLASLDVPWCKTRIDGRKGDHIETVSFHGTRGKSIYLRAYDKGVESGSDRPGVRIRMERQKRYRKDREVPVSEVTHLDMRKIYVGREFRKLQDLPTVTVSDLPGAILELTEKAQSVQQALRLAGYLVLGQWADENMTTPTYYRIRSELRSIGITIDPTQIKRLEVPVGRYLQALGSAWAA